MSELASVLLLIIHPLMQVIVCRATGPVLRVKEQDQLSARPVRAWLRSVVEAVSELASVLLLTIRLLMSQTAYRVTGRA